MKRESLQYQEYTTTDNDRWDLIANKFYKDPLKIEPIIAANSHLLTTDFSVDDLEYDNRINAPLSIKKAKIEAEKAVVDIKVKATGADVTLKLHEEFIGTKFLPNGDKVNKRFVLDPENINNPISNTETPIKLIAEEVGEGYNGFSNFKLENEPKRLELNSVDATKVDVALEITAAGADFSMNESAVITINGELEGGAAKDLIVQPSLHANIFADDEIAIKANSSKDVIFSGDFNTIIQKMGLTSFVSNDSFSGSTITMHGSIEVENSSEKSISLDSSNLINVTCDVSGSVQTLAFSIITDSIINISTGTTKNINFKGTFDGYTEYKITGIAIANKDSDKIDGLLVERPLYPDLEFNHGGREEVPFTIDTFDLKIPTVLPSGEKIKIPVLDVQEQKKDVSGLPPWKR